MKNTLLLISVAFITVLALSACKSHERCPAYGKVMPQTQAGIPS